MRGGCGTVPEGGRGAVPEGGCDADSEPAVLAIEHSLTFFTFLLRSGSFELPLLALGFFFELLTTC